MAQVERRGAVRVPARLAMEISVAGDTAQVESLNVSANGVYFASSLFIPVLTKLRITLELPGDDASGRTRSVVCDGVVVRSEPEEEVDGAEEYSVACYFTSIRDRDKETLEEYILKHVPF
jgi:hypothetical protein